MTAGGADVTAVGRLIFDASSVRAGVGVARNELQSLYNVVRDNWWGIRAIGDAFSTVGATINAGLALATTAAANFENAMARVARTTADATHSSDVGSASVQQLGAELMHLTEIKPVSLDVLTQIAEDAGALGVKRADVVEFTSTIVDLINTTNLTQDSATQLAKVANIFDLTGAEFKKFGSAVYEVGVNSAASESEIVALTIRLASSAKQFGLTAAQAAGLAAATISVGIQSEAGGTALQRFFQQIERASSGVDPTKLAVFAKVAGVTAKQFQEMSKNDPSKALSSLIVGLNEITKGGGNTTAALDAMGITEAREVRTLNALASGVGSVHNKYADLRVDIDNATKAYDDGTRAQHGAEQQYKTLSSQIVETKNIFHNIAIAFGKELVGPAKSFNSVVRDVAHGIEELPGPVKSVLVYLASTVGGFAALAGILLLVGPRISLAAAAYRSLTTALAVAVAAQRSKMTADEAENASNLRLAFSAGLHYKAIIQETQAKAREAAALLITQRLRNAELLLMNQETRLAKLQIAESEALAGGYYNTAGAIRTRIAATEADIAVTRNEILALEGEQAALTGLREEMTLAQVAAMGLGRAFSLMGGPLGIVLLAVTAVVTALGFMGSSEESTKESTKELASEVQGLTDALEKSAGAITNSIKGLLGQELASGGFITLAAKFKLSLSDLLNIITSPQSKEAKDILDKLKLAGESLTGLGIQAWNLFPGSDVNSQQANELRNELLKLIDSLNASKTAAHDTAQANKDLGTSEQDASNKTKDFSKTQQEAAAAAAKLQQRIDAAANAAANLASDELSVESAQQSLADANRSLTEALKEQHDLARKVAEDELQLKDDREGQRLAAISVKDAEQALSDARRKAHELLRDDIFAEKDAHSAYLDSLDKVAAARKALKNLGTDHEQKLLDLTNKLRDARIKLRQATITQSDAEYQLHYLIGEGASARDIANAREQLREANAGVKDSQSDLTDATKALNEERDVNLTKERAKAERELADAIRASKEALDKLHDAQDKVRQDRRDIKDDKAYLTAQKNLTDAQLALQQATDKVKASQDQLAKDRSGVEAAIKVRAATLAVKEAAVQLAQAQTQLIVDQRTANGQNVTATERLRILRGRLADVAGEIRKGLRPQVRWLSEEMDSAFLDRHMKVHLNTAEAQRKAAQFFHDFQIAVAGIPLLGLLAPGVNLSTNQQYPYGFHIGKDGLPVANKPPHPQHHPGPGGKHNGPAPQDGPGPGGDMSSNAVVSGGASFDQSSVLDDIATNTALTASLLDRAFGGVRGDLSNGVGVGKIDQSKTYHNQFHIEAHTDADPAEIGREVVWQMKTSL